MQKLRAHTTKSRREVVFQNIRWGVSWGLFLAVFFSIIACIIFLAQGSRPFANAGATLATTVLAYFLGGVFGGAIVGLLRPVARHALGAMLVGVPAAFPALFGFWLATQGLPNTWDTRTWLGLKIGTCIVGPFFGFLVWYQAKTRGRI